MVPLAPPSVHSALYHQSLHSSALELKYERSTHLVEVLAKDEDLRRHRLDIHCLEDDNDELREMLQQEEDRSDSFEKLVKTHLARAEDAEARLQDIEADLRQREQEVLSLQAEKIALQNSTEDATVALTEKLALTRELSVLKPELEHWKAQAASTEVLMSEKLALQRQLSHIQCELENARRDKERALAKRRNTGVEIAQEVQMDDLRRQLAKEKRARQRAEEAAEGTQSDLQVDDVRKELAKEKRARQKIEEKLQEALQATQVEDVRKDLLKEKKARKVLDNELEELRTELEDTRQTAARAAETANVHAEAGDQVETLRQELAQERKKRLKGEKAASQAAAEFEAQRETFDDKLNTFRTTLRTTKEKLQTTETELAAAKESLASAPAAKKKGAEPTTAASKTHVKKRNAAQMDSDATTLGTPGDGPAAKKGRKVAAVGEKSTFSITPFLNRTMSVAPESGDEAASPAATAPKQPLADKSNVPPAAAKKARAPRKPKTAALAPVTEEAEEASSQGQENKKPAAMTLKVKTKTGDEPDESEAAKQKKKVRRSILEFANFEKEGEVRKKRKLGGLGKTLFDEEEEAGAPAKGRGVFGMKGFGGLGAVGGGRKGGLLRPAGSTLLMTATDGSGFQFSPLKKSRRNLDDTLRG